MNNWIKLQVLLLTMAVVGVSCQTEADNILKAPPYAAITDSIRQFPNNATLYQQRALLLSQNNRHELATADFEKAWSLMPDEANTLQYASNLLLTDHAETAIAVLKKAIKQYPNNSEFQRRLSELYTQSGQPRQALQQYDELLKTDSTNFETWYEKGLLLARMQDTAEAIAALEKAYALQPINYTGIALANLYAAVRNPKTIAVCDALLSRDTSTARMDLFFLKGSYYSDTEQYEEAIKQFDECIKLDWKFLDAYLEKGIVQMEQKQYEEALKTFSTATTISNTSADAWFWVGRSYEAMGKKAEAIENYERAVSFDKNFVQAKERLRKLKDS